MREVLAEPPEYMAHWKDHFLFYPPGDWRAQMLLGEQWAMLASWFGAWSTPKGQRPRQYFARDIDPWLERPDQRFKRLREEQFQQLGTPLGRLHGQTGPSQMVDAVELFGLPKR